MPRPLAEAAALLHLSPPESPVAVLGVSHDSRAVQPGDLYAALPGALTHGARYVDQARSAGAVAVLTDPTGQDAARQTGLPVLVVPDPRAALGDVAAWAYGYPAHRLLLVGITGTNGKTTVSYLAARGLRLAGHRTGVVGTTGALIGDEQVPSARTTPEATDIHALLAVMVERGVTAAVLEVSSHALALGRVNGLRFDVAVFTNLSQDHLDFHGGLEEYFQAKSRLFTPAHARTAVVCVDDDWGRRLAAATALPVTTYGGPDTPADWQLRAATPSGTGQDVSVIGPAGRHRLLHVDLPGPFNALNVLAADLAVRAGGAELDDAAALALGRLVVPGRMERVAGTDGVEVFVDYAHTPDAVDRVLRATRPAPPGRVLVVLGCGGDRDRGKRPVIGAVAARLADLLVVTDDNPRSEDPAAIRAAVLAGAADVPEAERAEVVELGSRQAAIRAVADAARPGDAVLILGKGHEDGQEIAGQRYPFDDRVVAAEAFAAVRR